MNSKIILITGTSSGIGKETALLFSNKGWNVIATMRKTCDASCFKGKDNIFPFRLDVTDIDSISQSLQYVRDKFGRLDVVVNNAAYSLTGPFEAAEPEQIRALYDVNVFGPMNVVRSVIPLMREQGSGTIVNVSSLGGLIGMPFSTFYSSSKWALEGFSESLRFELEPLGIRVKVVEPGGVNTNFAKNAIILRKDDVSSFSRSMNRRISSYESRKDKLSSPLVIGKQIYKAATDKSGRLRFIAGRDAQMFWCIKRMTSFKCFTGIIKKLAT
jgi:NAD(P)-dependent dehydrogenase (short-subunit alcohol dehydrogenase family)